MRFPSSPLLTPASGRAKHEEEKDSIDGLTLDAKIKSNQERDKATRQGGKKRTSFYRDFNRSDVWRLSPILSLYPSFTSEFLCNINDLLANTACGNIHHRILGFLRSWLMISFYPIIDTRHLPPPKKVHAALSQFFVP